MDLVKLLLDWKVSYLVTEVDAAVCCLQLFIRELLPLAFVRLCKKLNSQKLRKSSLRGIKVFAGLCIIYCESPVPR